MNVLLDANVLYSITLTDVLLSLAEEGFLIPLWTERILQEAERNVTARQAKLNLNLDAIRPRFEAMRTAFEDAMIDPEEYEHLIPRMLNHESDRHVLAAAVAYRADVIVTNNLRHFPQRALADQPVGKVSTPDAFLSSLHDDDPPLLAAVIDRLLRTKQRPPMTFHDLASRLEGSGASRFAARLNVAIGLRGRR